MSVSTSLTGSEWQNPPRKAVPWPKEWPGLDSPQAKQRRGGSYSIFLPGSEEVKLGGLLWQIGESRALELGGRRWSVSARPTFPSEPVWRVEFRKDWRPD